MSYEQRPNSGSLFKNAEKQQETHADYRGDCLIDGKLYWMNAWLKTSKKGTKFMSVSFKPKMAQEHKGATKNPPPRQSDEPAFGDDSIPF